MRRDYSLAPIKMSGSGTRNYLMQSYTNKDSFRLILILRT